MNNIKNDKWIIGVDLANGEDWTHSSNLLDKAKAWFGQGEYDSNKMISLGAITEQQVVEMYLQENSK